MNTWYYVDGSERVGPVDESKLESLVKSGHLTEESYVWKKGFTNWTKLKDVSELSHLLVVDEEEIPSFEVSGNDFPPIIDQGGSAPSFTFENLGPKDKVISIKIGIDRGGSEVEYGPYTLEELKKAFHENRINEKTLCFIPGMKEWIFLSDIPKFKELFGVTPPMVSDVDRRRNSRRPFVARMFLHDSRELLEGVCRDISIGGMQILVSDFPYDLGDEISLNVHPDNDLYNFVATGLLVRKLEGNQGFAIRFVNLSDEAEKAIYSYLNNN